jgi:hypothetical protein
MPQSKIPNAQVIFVVGISLFLGGCKQTVPPRVETAPTVSVEELLANPQRYAHTIVKASARQRERALFGLALTSNVATLRTSEGRPESTIGHAPEE